MNSNEPIAPISKAKAVPDPCGPTDRRQWDGLGLLPRTTTPEERARRQRLSRVIGCVLMIFGVVAWISSIYGLLQFQEVMLAFSAFLAVLIAVCSVQLASRQERRKVDRRRPGQDTE